jgi:phosphoserine aminotransferase
MLALEDYLDALTWAEGIGGLKALITRSQDNLGVLDRWVRRCGWADFLASEQGSRSNTSVCLKIIDPWFRALGSDAQADAAKKIASLLENEGVAYDIAGYRAAPPGLRIWCGATVDKSDLEALTPWLDWAWTKVKSGQSKT